MATLDQLRVLATLKEAGSFGAAAARLHRAQSAVSYAVRTLETELGIALFDRSGHRARLTPAGEAVLGKGREVLDKAGELEALARELRGEWEPRLTLLMDGMLPVHYVLPRLAPFTGGGLPSQLHLRVELLGGVLDALERDRPDVAIAPVDLVSLLEAYACETLGEIVMLPVVARAHPLARLRPPVPLEVLRRHVHLIVSDSTRHRVPMDAGLIGAEQRWNFPDFATRLEGLRAGLGFAWMPTYLVEADLRRGKLVPLTVEGRAPVRYQMGLLRRERPPLGLAGRMLLDSLRGAPPLVPGPPKSLLAGLRRSARRPGRRRAD
jgi:DNA-binding transcriptional LysR family regulator